MKKAAAILILGCLLFSEPTRADMFGASDSVVIVKLSGIYQAMKDFYNSNVKVLAEARAQSDELKKISQFSKEAQQEYNFVKNFSIQNELDQIKGDIEGLTNLDNMASKSPEEQLRLLRDEIDRRFKMSKTKEEREHNAQLKSYLENIDRLNKLKQAKTDEAKRCAVEEQSEKNSMGSIASSCALISSLNLAREQRRIEEELAGEVQKQNDRQLQEQFREALGKIR